MHLLSRKKCFGKRLSVTRVRIKIFQFLSTLKSTLKRIRTRKSIMKCLLSNSNYDCYKLFLWVLPGRKKINPWLRKRKRLDKSINARCGPFVLINISLNVEGLSANKICVISQLATRHKALIIFLQETNCTNANQL